ncbi:5-methyltetrahydropteroyltriglutamate--homocysteine S-methyltransferase [Sphingosinicellaceae bacterium]|nr:5-methyltetrahydropteroyltriglutamate--homocysteine S-methyltransferase [Sphingosinicellaceae bacterium]
MSVTVANLGFPRIGPRRELKTAVEAYWAGRLDQAELLEQAKGLRAATWARQNSLGLDVLPSNDFSFYDHVLDTSIMVGAVPAIYRGLGVAGSLDVYFAMARGTRTAETDDANCGHSHGSAVGSDVPAQEMTKWFDTNYHYMVPEVEPGQAFALGSSKAIDEFVEARALGYHTRPVVLGPVTYLLLAKSKSEGFDPLTLLPSLLPVYVALLRKLHAAGADWVQIDEPALVLDLNPDQQAAFTTAYTHFSGQLPGLKLMLTTYFGALDDNLATALALPVAGLHVDLIRAPEQLDAVVAGARPDQVLSLGIVDGRNVWKTDLAAVLERVGPLAASGRRVQLAPSCSLLHTPIDLGLETRLDPAVRPWLAFAVQKIAELATLAKALNQGRASIVAELDANAAAITDRRASPLANNAAVRLRLAGVTANWTRRVTPFAERTELQKSLLHLPPLPTTTIGSFPQTAEVRQARAAHGKGSLDDADYNQFLRDETARAVRWQDEIGLDVLVHGEFERNDMVQYFGEQLSGFAFTNAGWVQSYGSRCVRPPIIYGDVARPQPMTVDWWSYAQSLTDKPMKGMLTGPVTILQWSFVRDDQPRSQTCRQIALAIRDEVVDLERAGAKIIQIDEAALREGLPLRRTRWQHYLDWAVEAFRISASGVRPQTQIHTHMCYSEFNDIIAAIGAMDADVISIETARSKMELLDAFTGYRYPNDIGPGVYDIHSPRIPAVAEMSALLVKASHGLAVRQLWVNPDCGLKTRKWEDVKPALANMVEAARNARASLA